MNIRPPRSAKADLVAAEASTWFIEFRTEETSAADRTRFYEWLRRSPDHIQAYLEIAEGWAELPTADPDHRLDLSALIELARQSPDDNVVPLLTRSAKPTQNRRRSMTAWAASFVGVTLAACLGVWVYQSQANTYRTGVGEQRTVRLLDGSTVELNALSSVRVRLSERVREVDLQQGQALFHVAKDKARPFLVHSDGITVRAVGTQFDVYRKSSGTVVTVLEGRVAVSEASLTAPVLSTESQAIAPLFLVAGEQVIVPAKESANKEVPKQKHADVAVATAWVQKRLVFEDTPLADVAEEFNRYNTRQLVISDPALRAMGISGVYSSTDPDSLLGFLRAQPGIELSETDKEIRVTLRGKK
jgi:transmembrane sensor